MYLLCIRGDATDVYRYKDCRGKLTNLQYSKIRNGNLFRKKQQQTLDDQLLVKRFVFDCSIIFIYRTSDIERVFSRPKTILFFSFNRMTLNNSGNRVEPSSQYVIVHLYFMVWFYQLWFCFAFHTTPFITSWIKQNKYASDWFWFQFW